MQTNGERFRIINYRQLTPEERRNTLTAGDPASDYVGHPEVMRRIIEGLDESDDRPTTDSAAPASSADIEPPAAET